MTFLCRVSRTGAHFAHVHDEPSYYADVMRHVEMGWEMADHCKYPNVPHSSGDPGSKPFQVFNLTGREPGGPEYFQRSAPNHGYREDHHTRLVFDYAAAERRILTALEEGAGIVGYGDYVDFQKGVEFIGYGDHIDFWEVIP